MNLQQFSRRFLIIQGTIIASYSLLTAFLLLLHKNQPGPSFLSDISTSRLIATIPPFSVAVMTILFVYKSLAKWGNSGHPVKYLPYSLKWAIIQKLALLAAILGLAVFFLPSYHFDDYAEYYIRLQPLIIWLGILGLHIYLLILFYRQSDFYKQIKERLSTNQGLLRLSFWILLIFALLWIIIAGTGTGLGGHEDFWYEAGVPILPAQILLSISVGLLFAKVEPKLIKDHSSKLDVSIFWGIWITAALFWGMTPVTESYFNPRPLPPNHEMYPYSDAAGYDLQSQSVLIGEGLDNGRSVDNPLYPVFLVFLHRVSGQNYELNMALQAAIFAVLPAIVYMLGKSLAGRSAGITAACMTTFHGYNSIVAASMINLAGPKQMLTDFPTAIGVALSIFTLLFIFDKEHEKPAGALWHGAAIAFAFLIRSTALVLLAVSPIVAIIHGFTREKWIRITLLTLTGFIFFVFPWGVRNTFGGANAVSIYLNKLSLVSNERFPETKENRRNEPADSEAEQTQLDADNSRDTQLEHFSIITKFVLEHFANNVIGSTLIIPTSPMFDDIRHTIKSPDTIWFPFWNGRLTLGQTITLALVLTVLAVGLAASWKFHHVTGLAPLIVLLTYHLANSVGRTSGGRFIAPVGWIVIYYFSVGTITICRLFSTIPADTKNQIIKTNISTQKILATLFAILFLGSIPLAAEFSLAKPFASTDEKSILSDSNFQEALLQSSYNEEQVTLFLKGKDSVLIYGQAMYPRYFGYKAVTQHAEGGIKNVSFPHLEFYLIEPGRTQSIVLYKMTPLQLPNSTKVFILGCRGRNIKYIDALAVMIGPPEITTYTRESNPPLECPLQKPICDNNGNCQ